RGFCASACARWRDSLRRKSPHQRCGGAKKPEKISPRRRNRTDKHSCSILRGRPAFIATTTFLVRTLKLAAPPPISIAQTRMRRQLRRLKCQNRRTSFAVCTPESFVETSPRFRSLGQIARLHLAS